MPAQSRSTEYCLMNKDAPVLTFLCCRNAFDEPEFTELAWATELRPIGYTSLTAFLEHRKAPKHREHIRALLEQFGCDDLEGFLRVSHALSLGDTFWVKEAASPLRWAEVSLYRNEFNRLISEAAFDGTVSETDISSTSPEFGTDGYYAKCWMREGGRIFLYKTGSALYETEPLSEYLASQLASAICPNSVRYDLDFYHGRLISKCELFTDEQHGLAKASSIFRGEVTIPRLLDYFASVGSEDSFRRMCVLDALTFNPDRHYGNFGMLFDTDTMQAEGMAPVFDNNRALFPELDEAQLASPEWYLQKCKPRIGRDFVLTARGLLTPELRTELKNLEGFHFAEHPTIELPQKRLDLLSALVNRRIREILA